MSRVYFIFNTREGYFLVEAKDVENVPKPRELVRRAAAVEVLREYAEKEGIEFATDKARKRTKHTQETKDKISAAVKANHGHKDGLKEEHIEKIVKHHTGKYRGSDNNMWGKKHKLSTRLKMSEKRRARGKYKNICNPNGWTSIPENDPVPEGYQLGTIYDPYRIVD
jgi:hypothetical protein